MVNGIIASDVCRLSKERGSNFCVGQETPEEGGRTYRPKSCEYNNKDEDNSPKTLNDKNIFLTHKWNANRYYYSGSELTWE